MKPEDLRYEDFHWDSNKLYCGKKDTELQINPDPNYPTMWRFKYKDYTSDIFNKSRVKDNAVYYMLEEYRKTTVQEPLGASLVR